MVSSAPRLAPGLAACLATAMLTAAPSCVSAKSLRVLFVGNSFTFVNDLPHQLAHISASLGEHDITVANSTIGGCTAYYQRAESDTRTATLLQKDWDFIVLQVIISSSPQPLLSSCMRCTCMPATRLRCFHCLPAVRPARAVAGLVLIRDSILTAARRATLSSPPSRTRPGSAFLSGAGFLLRANERARSSQLCARDCVSFNGCGKHGINSSKCEWCLTRGGVGRALARRKAREVYLEGAVKSFRAKKKQAKIVMCA